jgi:hypothetical protein
MYSSWNKKYKRKCSCRIWGSHSGGYEEFYLLGCNTVQSVESQPIFRGKISPPSSGRKSKPRKNIVKASGLFFDPEDGSDMLL